MGSRAFDELNEAKLKELLAINPDLATNLGLHEPYDWQLPHGGSKRYEDTLTLYDSWQAGALEIADKEELTIDQKLALKSLKYAADMLRFSLDDYPLLQMNPDALELAGGLLFVMLTREYAPLDQRISAMTSRIGNLPRYLGEFRSRFEDSKAVRAWTRVAIESAEQFPQFLQVVAGTANGKIPDSLVQDLARKIRECEKAIDEQVIWLKELEKSSTDKFAMGKRKFAKLIKTRELGLTPAEMMSLGQKYLEEFKKEREVVAERIAPGKGVKWAAAAVRKDSPATFEDALKVTEDVMNRAKQFIIVHRLATIDLDAKLNVIETPSFMATVLPYAAMYEPSKFDRNKEGAYIVTRPKDPKDLSSHLNHASIVNTAVHEAYPGHFAQAVESNKEHWMFLLPGGGGSEVASATAETHEGWAHYCEKMMFDHGFEANDPAEFEMLNGAIWRACRIIADIKLAQGEATIDEMVEWITSETGMSRDAMQVEVLRYSHTPGQALSYMIGRHLMLELKEQVQKSQGAGFDERVFHDSVLRYAALPFDLLREAVDTKLDVGLARKSL